MLIFNKLTQLKTPFLILCKMEHMKKIAVLLIFLTLVASCSKDHDDKINDEDYLIFGHFYGFCIGENCVETFKLTNDAIYEDLNDDYINAVFEFELLSNNKFIQVKDLIDFFPTELLEEENDILGCPDCSDGGGLYIEYSKNGIIKSWKIDLFKNNIPDYLHNFMDMVNEKISIINN